MPDSHESAAFAEQAIADLAARLHLDAKDITVVRAVAVTWRDGSIGCAQPGMAYTQALVSGHLIELLAEGETYRYHQGGSRAPFYCDHPTEPYQIEG